MKIFGVFRVKNHDFTPKNHIFSNFRGGGALRVRPPHPWIRPCNTRVNKANYLYESKLKKDFGKSSLEFMLLFMYALLKIKTFCIFIFCISFGWTRPDM